MLLKQSTTRTNRLTTRSDFMSLLPVLKRRNSVMSEVVMVTSVTTRDADSVISARCESVMNEKSQHRHQGANQEDW